jgi:hypothetical protein
MSPHDELGSKAIALKRQLEQYVEEFAPIQARQALYLISRLVIVIDRFPMSEEELDRTVDTRILGKLTSALHTQMGAKGSKPASTLSLPVGTAAKPSSPRGSGS